MMGRIDKHEFEAIMKILFSSILFRVMFQYFMIVLWTPMFVAAAHAAFFMSGARSQVDVIMTASLHSTVTQAWSVVRFAISLYLPDSIVEVAEFASRGLRRIPSETWSIIPFVLLSMIMCMSIMRWGLMRIFGRKRGESRKKRRQQQNQQAVPGRRSSPF